MSLSEILSVDLSNSLQQMGLQEDAETGCSVQTIQSPEARCRFSLKQPLDTP